MRALERPQSAGDLGLGLARGVGVAIFLGAVIGATNLAQLGTLLVLPVSRSLFRRANRSLVRLAFTRTAAVAERLHRLQVVPSGDALPPDDNALVLVNHQSTVDVNCVFSFAWRQGRLGDLRWFAKAPLRHVPGVGWGLRFLDTLFVTRRWERDQATIAGVFARMHQAPAPFWLLMFSEGTRRRPASIARSRARAEAEGRRQLEHLLLPRTRGFVATVGALRDQAHAVYDLTIGYPDGVPTLWDLLRGFVRRVHLHVRRFPLSELPHDEAGLEAWLFARWSEKDQLIAGFAAQGHFPGEAA